MNKECTFIETEDKEKALKKKHMHWEFLKPHVEENKGTTFVLIHFSLRYKDEFIQKFFSQQKLPNVIVWLEDKVNVDDTL